LFEKPVVGLFQSSEMAENFLVFHWTKHWKKQWKRHVFPNPSFTRRLRCACTVRTLE